MELLPTAVALTGELDHLYETADHGRGVGEIAVRTATRAENLDGRTRHGLSSSNHPSLGWIDRS